MRDCLRFPLKGNSRTVATDRSADSEPTSATTRSEQRRISRISCATGRGPSGRWKSRGCMRQPDRSDRFKRVVLPRVSQSAEDQGAPFLVLRPHRIRALLGCQTPGTAGRASLAHFCDCLPHNRCRQFGRAMQVLSRSPSLRCRRVCHLRRVRRRWSLVDIPLKKCHVPLPAS